MKWLIALLAAGGITLIAFKRNELEEEILREMATMPDAIRNEVKEAMASREASKLISVANKIGDRWPLTSVEMMKAGQGLINKQQGK